MRAFYNFFGTVVVFLVGIKNTYIVTMHYNFDLCSSVVRLFTHGAMGHQIDLSCWTHRAISLSSQCSTTGVTKTVVCVILSVGWCI